MIKDTILNNKNISINNKEISILKEHFPSCFKKDGSFDLERFKEELKDKVDIVHEGYELKFLGKSYAKLLASLDTTTVITPNSEHNNLPENKDSENIYISGDNLDGLKHLLKSYSKSVKCIYIDPPYNTGSDGFVYKDNFNFTVDELQDKLSVDETQAKRILDLTKRDSASHSAWLMFMYARLQLAKDLLKDDGVIFISIDDNEQANLKLLCDDIFGEENLISSLVWHQGRKSAGKTVAINHEYCLIYSRNKIKIYDANKEDLIYFRERKESLDLIYKKEEELRLEFDDDYNRMSKEIKIFYKSFDDEHPIKRNKHYDKFDKKGLFFADNTSAPDNPETRSHKPLIHPVTKKETSVPAMGWRYNYDNLLKLVDEDRIYFGIDEQKVPCYKRYLKETEYEFTPSVFYKDGRGASKRLEKLFEFKVFDFPKDETIIKKFISFISVFCNEKDIVLDFFSGSATTAHSVMQLNAEDGGNRNFIAIQLPEDLDLKKESQKNAYNFLNELKYPTTLDYIGFERIKRASKKIKAETKAEIDYGFKHFILNEPNQNTLDKCETFDKASLLGDATILDDFGTETVLTTWLNNDGYGLNAKVETIDLKGYTAYYCQKHLYLINSNFTQEALVVLFEKYDTIAGFNPENIVLFGYSFNEWSVTEMLEKNLKILNDSEKNLKINIDVRY
ncbi:site-specific DNA-methyltransferase [Flavobacterium sp.]|uniref:site-specific DNA-methyltransferase n=1 Tax=Flavobacterium sp. TaxID=239 RepID=UPI00375225E9